jgi:signal transduction histidine kinase/ligand-binding sensor domain-containing protein
MTWSARPGIDRRLREPAHCGRLILLVVAALVLCSPSAAMPSRQPVPPAPAIADLTFQRLTVADGLSHPRVISILQDHRGFMWFGTTAGLNRYDGYTMTTLASDTDDPARLRAIIISALAEDHDGRLWVGSNADGLAAYDPRTGRFARFPHNPQDADSPSANDITSLLVDRGGALWVGTLTGGLSRRDPASGRFTSFRHDPADPASLSSDRVQEVYEDRAGTLWVGTDGGGLDRLDPASGRFTHQRHDPATTTSLSSDRVQEVYEDRAGTLWVGTITSGLDSYDRRTGQFTHYRHDEANPTSLSDDNVTAIHEDRDGRLWVGTQNGLNRFDRATGLFTVYRHDPADPASLPLNGILSLYEDTSGLLWIATDGLGVAYVRLYGWPFHRFVNQADNPDSLGPGVVRGVAADPDGKIWAGTFGSGLNRLDPRTGQVVHYRHDLENSQSLSDDLVWAVLVDRAGTPWIGTGDGTLNRFDRTSGTFRHYSLGPPGRNFAIYAIDQDRSGALWIGTFGGGLRRFDPATGTITAYTSDPGAPRSLSSNLVRCVVAAQDGTVWVGTYGGGLNHLDPRTGVVTTYRRNPDDSGSISSDNISAMFEDSAQTLWAGTAAGLNRFDRATGRFTTYTDPQGLPSGIVQGIVEAGGELWISTLNGMSRFDPRAATFRNYTSRGDILSEGFTGVSLIRAGDGAIYAGGFGGLVAFDPTAFRDEAFVPPVVLTDFRINNQPVAVDADSPLQQPIDETTALTLREGDRTFSIAFAALDYWAPDRARYRYKLDGVDADWVEVGSERRAITYAGLRPGTYTLHVRAASRDGSWSGPNRTLAITIPPFVWERGWFQLGVVALFGILIFGLLRANTYRARARQRQLEQQVAERTRELSKRTAELERAEAETRQSRDELATQLVVSQQIVATLDLDPLLERILEQLERIERFDAAAIYKLEDDALVIRAFRSAVVARKVQGIQVDLTRASSLRIVLTTRQPLILADRAADPEELAYFETLLGDTCVVHAWMGIPLIVKDWMIGVLSLFHHEVGCYGPRAQERVQLFANQAALAIENAQLYQAAQEAAALEERHRLAHDLHDAVTQSVFSASLIAGALQDTEKVSPATLRQGLEDLRQITRGALAEMRALLYELHPSGLAEKPLGQLLDSLCTAFTSRTRIAVALTMIGMDHLQPEVQEALYRIAQEALNNISKHAGANAARVALTCSAEEVVLVIADDGRGFEISDGSAASPGMGMGSMRERASRIGAVLRIDSRPGQGTTITVVWSARPAQAVIQRV